MIQRSSRIELAVSVNEMCLNRLILYRKLI
jgi:hypothetical protein